MNYIKWGFESRLKHPTCDIALMIYYIKWGFESRLKLETVLKQRKLNYIKWGFESRLKHHFMGDMIEIIISNGDLRVD